MSRLSHEPFYVVDLADLFLLEPLYRIYVTVYNEAIMFVYKMQMDLNVNFAGLLRAFGL